MTGPRTGALPWVTARVVDRGALYRAIDVVTPGRVYRVAYEAGVNRLPRVLVDGDNVADVVPGFWMPPRYHFGLGPWPAELHVRVWPWYRIRRLSLTVAGHQVYTEGFRR
jgi:hypothetical protein